MIEICCCGLPLHYSDPAMKDKIDEMIKELGTHIEVVLMDKTYRVPRHFIALHGLKSYDLEDLRFEVKNES